MGIKIYDIILADLDGAQGSEQGKIRPCVVVQNNIGNQNSSTVIIMPLTHILKSLHLPTHAIIKKSDAIGLNCDSMVLAEQIRTIDKRRIKKKLGMVRTNEAKNALFKAYTANFTGIA